MSNVSADHVSVAVRPGLDFVEQLITRGTSIAAATLIVVEIGILLVGVIARYVFGSPLSWSDELAGILFLWLAMAGVVIAFNRGQHMCIRMVADRMPARPREWCELYATVTAAIVFAVALYCGLEHAINETIVLTSAMEISGTWRAAALPIGFGLLTLLSIIRGTRYGVARLMIALITLFGAMAFLWVTAQLLSEFRGLNLILFFGFVVIAALIAGVSIGIVFLFATLLYLGCCTFVPLTVVIGRFDEGMSHFILLSVPLFVFLGKLMEETGMARAIMSLLWSLIGHLRGGLSYVLLAAMFIVSGISGSKVADMAAVAPVLFPEMKRRGWKPGELIALLSSSGAMAETIPPSLILITTGVTVGVSIAALFTAGLLPAAFLAALLCVVTWWRSKDELPASLGRPSWQKILSVAVYATPGMLLPIVIRSAVVEGVATPTEVSTIGIIYTAIVGLVLYRPFPWARLSSMLVDTATLSGAILFIVGAATSMAWALTQSGFSADLSAAVTSLPGGYATFMFVSVLFFIALGSLLEGLPAIILFAPLLFPTAAALGINDVHYTIVVVLAMGVGLFIPPFGIGYWAACAIGQVDPDEGVKPLVPYLMALLLGLAIIAAVPWISIGFL